MFVYFSCLVGASTGVKNCAVTVLQFENTCETASTWLNIVHGMVINGQCVTHTYFLAGEFLMEKFPRKLQPLHKRGNLTFGWSL